MDSQVDDQRLLHQLAVRIGMLFDCQPYHRALRPFGLTGQMVLSRAGIFYLSRLSESTPLKHEYMQNSEQLE